MDAGIASTILFVYPVLVAIIMAVFFHEKVSFITMFSIALAFTGISLLYEGGDGKTLSMLGVLFVILSSLTYAIYIVGVNRSSLKELPTAKLTFYACSSASASMWCVWTFARLCSPSLRRCCGQMSFRWLCFPLSFRWC